MVTNILLETGTNELEIVEFFIEKDQGVREYYGINVIKVQEIMRYPKITSLPQRPHECFVGLMRVREEIIPLLDLGMYLYKKRLDTSSKVIITEFNKMKIGFLVSGLTRIHRISWENVSPPVEIEYGDNTPCITGVIKFEDRIVFILDVEKIVTDMAPIFEDPKLKQQSEEGTNYKVLVVDDSPTIRRMLVSNLKGFDVHVASNGQEAFDYLKSLGSSWDEIIKRCNLVISDIEMPQMDGFTLTKKIKEDPILRDLPVILFSSMIIDKLLHKGKAVGADDQITKPEIGQLADRARQLIEERISN